ncbi:MAG: hypothetical protein GY765_28120 [bacterium]|nr:hypothetical protein [bacterium]
MDFTVDKRGNYKKRDMEKVTQRLINEAQTATSALIQHLNRKDAIRSAKVIGTKIMEGLHASKAVEMLGVEPQSVNVPAVKANPEMQKALEAQTRGTAHGLPPAALSATAILFAALITYSLRLRIWIFIAAASLILVLQNYDALAFMSLTPPWAIALIIAFVLAGRAYIKGTSSGTPLPKSLLTILLICVPLLASGAWFHGNKAHFQRLCRDAVFVHENSDWKSRFK